MTGPVPSNDKLADVELTDEQVVRSDALEHDCIRRPASASMEIIYLRDEIERLREHIERCQKAAIERSAPEPSADARDASRYRWLRADNAYAPEENMVMGGEELDSLCDRGIAYACSPQPPEPTHFAFLVKRPRDKEAWPTIFASRESAEGYEHRASPVVSVCLAQSPSDAPVYSDKPAISTDPFYVPQLDD